MAAPLRRQRSQSRTESIPFWRDGRVLGVLAQIAFVIIFLLAASWLVNNILSNISRLGPAQFRCRDGGESFRCAFDFLTLESQFDIGERPIPYTPADSYGRAFVVGLLNTVKVAGLGIILATVLGTFTGIARLSSNWLASNVAKAFVDLFRNTPLLVQLFFIYFGVLLLQPPIRSANQPFGLPIFFSQRGVDMPWPVAMSSFNIWLIFLVLGLIPAAIVWIYFGRWEKRMGRGSNRPLWALLAFAVVATAGWMFAATAASQQSILTPPEPAVTELADFEEIVAARLGVADLAEVDDLLAAGTLTAEQVEEASLTVCIIRDTAAETNIIAELERANLLFSVRRSNDIRQAMQRYNQEECEIVAAPTTTLTAARDNLENGDSHHLVSVREMPVRLAIPRLQGLNFVGGLKLSVGFTAILTGLVLYTGAFIAEIVRAGIQSVSKGQSEAARALGLSEAQRLRLVVLPQALRVIVPPLTSQYLNLTKNSSLAVAVGFPDFWMVSTTTINQSGRIIQVILIAMAVYLSFSLFISFLLNWYNRRIALVER
jgi:general L-amino acid transport system permease protein